jgi:hypothetical protein
LTGGGLLRMFAASERRLLGLARTFQAFSSTLKE